MNLKTKLILSVFTFLTLGAFINNWTVQKLKSIPPHHDLGKINLAMNDSTPITIWGSSTAYMNVIPAIIKERTNLKVYNFGIGGAAYDQLHHLADFSSRNRNKTIIWIVNPYELENYDYKLQEEELFLHWIDRSSVQEMFEKQSNFKSLAMRVSNWYSISQLNAKHWNYIFNPSIDFQPNQDGYISRSNSFNENNNFYPTNEFSAIEAKVKDFKNLASKIALNNQLVVVIPPVINDLSFESFEKRIQHNSYRVINATKNPVFRDTIHYQDNVHLNQSGAQLFSEILADSILRIID